MLTGFAALLGRYTGEREVMIGTPVAARNRVESEGLIGFFVNTLVVRAELGGDPTGSELVGRVRQVCLEAYAHQEVPFERLVEELQVERTLSHAPLFQVMFGMNNVEREQVELAGRERELEVDSGTTKFDLTMQVEEGESDGRVSYSLDLFEAESMERLTAALRAFAGGAGSESGEEDQRVGVAEHAGMGRAGELERDGGGRAGPECGRGI